MAKEKPNQGWTKEIAKGGTPSTPKKPFGYNNPVSRTDNPNNMAVNSRSRAYKSVSPDKSTGFKSEQNQAKASHKGNK